MTLTEEQLKELEALGALHFSPRECAIILKCAIKEFIDEIEDISSELAMTYQRGKLRAEAEVRKTILTQARQGSMPAQKQMLARIEQSRKKEKNY